MFKQGEVGDLVLLSRISEEEIVATLERRFKSNDIYTYIGSVLLSVNPFKNISGLYGPQQIRQYRGRYLYELPPHIYAIAESAYRDLISNSVSQCILVSGESGAGKTEGAKKVMEYIAAVSGQKSGTQDVSQVKDRILQSNPLLEAFGNAKTLRNDNSSRFGKYMEIFFDYGGVPIGGRVSNYLLEKPRVVGQGQRGERAFHVFYQLCAACANGELTDLQVNSPHDYVYLAATECVTVNRINDYEEFQATVQSMDAIGIGEQDRNYIFMLTAAVMTLGNVMFEGRGDNAQVAAATRPYLQWVAYYLGVSEDALERALVNRTITARGENMRKPLTTEEAAYTRDALAKALYARNFQQIVQFLNASLSTRERQFLTIGVLDIYGFEIFDNNSFEQLCINFCNEKLQQLFIELTLKTEQEEYAREGIQWEPVEYFNNKIVCDLIEGKRPPGILALLDEECLMPQGTDRSLHAKLAKVIGGSNRHFTVNSEPYFTVNHYAGDVVYSVESFCDKNRDALFNDLITLMSQSAYPYMVSLFPEAKEVSMQRPPTAGTQFRQQMNDLIQTLLRCNPHYVRCIKPNHEKRAGVFTTDMVTHQTRYLGLLENVIVRRAGYAYRQTYERFFNRYRMLSPTLWPYGTGNHREDCNTILMQMGVDPHQFQFGNSKIFIRKPVTLFSLEEMRERKLHDLASIIQRAYKSWKAIKFFLELKKQAMSIFKGRKRRAGSMFMQFYGDYIGARDSMVMHNLLAKAGDARPEFLFADTVIKVNRRGREQSRIIVLTRKGFYTFQPPLEKAVLKSNCDILQINGLSLSTMADNWIIVHEEERDQIFVTPHKAELTSLLSNMWAEKRHGAPLPLHFSDALTCRQRGTGFFRSNKLIEMHLQFVEDPSAPPKSTAYVVDERDKTHIRISVHPLLCSEARYQLNSRMSTRTAAREIAANVKREISGLGGAAATFAASLTATTTTRPPSTRNLTPVAPRGPRGPPPPVAKPAPPSAGGRAGPPPPSKPPAPTVGGGATAARPPPTSKPPAPGGARPPAPTVGGGATAARPPPPTPAARPPPPPRPRGQPAVVLWDFTGQSAQELSLRAGDQILVLEQNPNGWWLVSHNNKTGLFPGSYTQLN